MTSEPGQARQARDKVLSPSWLDEQLARAGIQFSSVYEPFAGQATVSRYFKRAGKRAIAGDLLESHYCHALALVENDDRRVEPARLAAWTAVLRDPAVAKRFAPWANRHFTPEETIWLGIWHAHVGATEEPIERALGSLAVAQTMRYWLSFNAKGLGHKPLAPSVVFSHYVQTVNTWVCSSRLQSQALWGDAYLLAPRVEADLLFCYPPTDRGFLGYPETLFLFECWVKGDPELVLPGATSSESDPPTLGLPQPAPSLYADALRRFLSRVEHIPVWAVAFNDRYPLQEAAMVDLIKEFRPIRRGVGLNVLSGDRGTSKGERLIIAGSASRRRDSRPESPES